MDGEEATNALHGEAKGDFQFGCASFQSLEHILDRVAGSAFSGEALVAVGAVIPFPSYSHHGDGVPAPLAWAMSWLWGFHSPFRIAVIFLSGLPCMQLHSEWSSDR
jgi:hypothetical protein